MDYLAPDLKIQKLRDKFEETTGQKTFYRDKDKPGVVLNLNYVEWLEQLTGGMLEKAERENVKDK